MGPASPGLGARGALHFISSNWASKMHIDTESRESEAGGRRETSYFIGWATLNNIGGPCVQDSWLCGGRAARIFALVWESSSVARRH